jgi:two-component system, chemotaxis family, chemotaxis protein CheY
MMARILIIDDTRFMRTILKTIVTEEGYEVVGEAADGYQGIFEYVNNHPDLVLLDILMPKMDGIMTLKTLIGYDPSVRVIIISAIQSVKMIKLAINCGAKGYILKPFQRPQLMQEIHRVLEDP